METKRLATVLADLAIGRRLHKTTWKALERRGFACPKCGSMTLRGRVWLGDFGPSAGVKVPATIFTCACGWDDEREARAARERDSIDRILKSIERARTMQASPIEILIDKATGRS